MGKLSEAELFSVSYRIGASALCGRKTLRYSAIVDYMQDCSVFHLLTLNALQNHFREHNIGMYVVSRQIDIFRLPCYAENITLSTYVYECRQLYGFRNTMIYGENGELCAVCSGAGAFIGMDSKKPIKMPVEVIRSIPVYEKADMEYLPRKIALPDNVLEVRQCEPVKVMKYHIDANEHVNNARYVDIAEEAIELGSDVKRIRLDFRTPAKIDDTIVPIVYRCKDKITVDLKCGDSSCALVEFGK